MKRNGKMIAVALSLVLCMGLLAGCSEDTSNSAATGNTNASQTTSTNSESSNASSETLLNATDVTIGRVVSVEGSEMTLVTYNALGDTIDYATLDLGDLTSTSQNETITIEEGAVFNLVSESGELVAGTQNSVHKNDTVIVTTGESGEQEFIIHPAQSSTEYKVGRVSSIEGEGSFMLAMYKANDENATIEDYANVDFSQYTARGNSTMYNVKEGTVISVAESGSLQEATAADIVEGDMLVIYTDAEGVNQVVVYHNVAE